MRIAITGASGFVGRQLIPKLSAAGVELLLIGRNSASLAQMFPGKATCEPAALSERGRGFDILLHLAARNNNQPGSLAEFESANVHDALATLQSARRAGIPRFIYVSSVHALDPSNRSPYAESKRHGAEVLLSAQESIETNILYLSAVHGDRFSGKLSSLNRLPTVLRQPAFQFLSALRPTVSVDRIAEHLLSGAPYAKDGKLILSNGQEGNLFYAGTMRLLDYTFAVAVLLLFWWVLLGAYVAIRCDSEGSGLFVQPRIGRHGRVFKCWKFRTMQIGTVQAGTHEVSAAAVTRIGRFLRRTKLDELPQIWNILRGEIALIGPRPCLPVQTQLIEERNRRGVLNVLPGISGLAQVEGIDMSDPARLASRDAEYIALRCILLDLRLVLRTAFGAGQGDRLRS